MKLNKLNYISINSSPLLALPHPHLSRMRLTLSTDASVPLTAAIVFPFKHFPILPLLPISNGSWMYVIIPYITGASKPNKRLYQNDRLQYIIQHYVVSLGYAVSQLIEVAGSIPDGVIEIFHWRNPSGRTIALRSTQPLTEMSTRNIY
jgi:hypothetical protein